MAWGRSKSAQTPAWDQDDYHKEFAGKLKEQIEQGVAPWQKPWQPGEERLPKNIQTDKPYRGGNPIYLSVTQTAKGYSDHRWATYKQIKDMGGQVRKGESATPPATRIGWTATPSKTASGTSAAPSTPAKNSGPKCPR